MNKLVFSSDFLDSYFDPARSGKSSVRHLSSEMQVTAVELQVSENCLKNWQILQAMFPAYHWTVRFQTASRLLTKRAKKIFERQRFDTRRKDDNANFRSACAVTLQYVT